MKWIICLCLPTVYVFEFWHLINRFACCQQKRPGFLVPLFVTFRGHVLNAQNAHKCPQNEVNTIRRSSIANVCWSRVWCQMQFLPLSLFRTDIDKVCSILCNVEYAATVPEKNFWPLFLFPSMQQNTYKSLWPISLVLLQYLTFKVE